MPHGLQRIRVGLIGLGAACGVFAAAATFSATANADTGDYSAVIADVQAEEAAAATALMTASTDLASGDTADGLTQLFIGLDDDLIGIPSDLEVGTIDALTGAAVIPPSDFEFSFATPASFAAAVTEANTIYTAGTTLITTIGTLPDTDYADIALDNRLSTVDQYVLPAQIELIGELAYMF